MSHHLGFWQGVDLDGKSGSHSCFRPSNIPYQVTFVAGTGFTLFGYDQGVMSGLLTLPSFEAQFPNTAGGFEGSRTATLQSFMVAICEFWIVPQYT